MVSRRSRAHLPEQLVEHDAASRGDIQRSFHACHRDAHARVASLHDIRGKAFDLVSEDDEHREPWLPVEKVNGIVDGLNG